MTTTTPTPTTGPTAPPVETPPVKVPLQDAPQATPLTMEQFKDAIAHVMPQAEEMQWASIPWQTDLWEARKIASEQGKPIFAWMMNGNPLGCV